jgi:hypothetical protein
MQVSAKELTALLTKPSLQGIPLLVCCYIQSRSRHNMSCLLLLNPAGVSQRVDSTADQAQPAGHPAAGLMLSLVMVTS